MQCVIDMYKRTSLITIILTFITFMLFTTFPSITATDTTTIYVDPPTTTIEVYIGENFTVNVAIAEVTDLCGWEFKLYYNKTVINCINATEGQFLKAGGNTYFISNINNTYNATHGRAHVSCTLTGIVPGVNGSGVLATIEFQIKAGGETPLNLDETKLLDSSLPDPNPIDHNTTDGTVEITILSVPVGGIYIPVNKLELLTPYIGLTILLAVAVVAVVYVRKRKRDTEGSS